MEPVSALVIALVSAWAITRGVADAATAQAAQEARAAADAIRDDLRGRSEAWAGTLADRVAGGRAGGPSTAMWWAWAAARTGRAARGALRREPRQQERARQIRGTTGPWRRIFDAGVNGARFAREQARQQRKDQERPTGARLGVCEQCGAVVARQSLQPATVGPTRRRLRVCVTCRTAEADRAAREDAPPSTPPKASPREETPVDADVVDDPSSHDGRPAITAPRPALDAPRPGGEARPEPAPSTPPPPQQLAEPSTPAVARTVAAVADTPQLEEGASMAPRAPGQLVPRHGNRVAPRAARGAGGESYTHGMFNRAVIDAERRLAELPAALEVMLHSLTTADAGRSQVTGVVALADEIAQFMQQVKEMLTEVNRMERPVLTAVEAAGGPEEIAGIPYLREV